MDAIYVVITLVYDPRRDGWWAEMDLIFQGEPHVTYFLYKFCQCRCARDVMEGRDGNVGII